MLSTCCRLIPSLGNHAHQQSHFNTSMQRFPSWALSGVQIVVHSVQYIVCLTKPMMAKHCTEVSSDFVGMLDCPKKNQSTTLTILCLYLLCNYCIVAPLTCIHQPMTAQVMMSLLLQININTTDPQTPTRWGCSTAYNSATASVYKLQVAASNYYKAAQLIVHRYTDRMHVGHLLHRQTSYCIQNYYYSL